MNTVITFSAFIVMTIATLNVSTPAQRRDCRSVNGLSDLLKPGNILLFGELHGTEQAPAFVADVVCQAAKKRIPVTLGLEIPIEEQAAIDRFLRSRGNTADVAQLTEREFWHPELLDGRTSLAMLKLIEQTRALRKSGAKLRIVAYTGALALRSQERDRAMAESLASVAVREPKGLLVVLSGNIHNRLTRGTSWDKNYEPMGYLLTKSVSRSRINSLNMAHQGGEAWGCRTTSPDSDESICAAYTLRPLKGADDWSIALTAAPDAPFSGTYGIGRITSSPPIEAKSVQNKKAKDLPDPF